MVHSSDPTLDDGFICVAAVFFLFFFVNILILLFTLRIHHRYDHSNTNKQMCLIHKLKLGYSTISSTIFVRYSKEPVEI